MKPIRSLLLTVFLMIIAFSSIIYLGCHKDKCHNVVCLHLGVCDGGTCLCDVGYEGSRCEILSRDKFVATFNGHDICNINDTNRLHQYQLNFVAIPAKPLQFEMKNFIENPDDSAACTVQSTDSFTFFGSNNGTTFNGYGTLRKDTLRLSYRVQIDTVSFNCKYIGGSLW
jgi:hypothetical protein